jgi:putative DNA primase/helicase
MTAPKPAPALSLAPPADWGLETTAARARRDRAAAVLGPLAEAVANEHVAPGERLGAWARLKSAACDVAELLHVAGNDDLRDLLAAGGAIRGGSADYRALDAACRRVAADAAKAQTAAAKAWAAEQARQGPPRLTASGAAKRLLDLVGQPTVPQPFEMSDNGVACIVYDEDGAPTDKVKPVASRPMVLCGRAVDVDSGEHHAEVAWIDDAGRPVRQWVPRGDVMDGRKLLTLATHGAPVCSPTATEAARYLDALDSAWGPRLPARRIAARMGHHGAGFLRGAGWHPGPAPAAPEGEGAPDATAAPTAPPIHLTPPGGYEALCASVHSRGTWEAWQEAWSLAASRPIARLAVYAALASVILPWTTGRGCVVDLWGHTSIGKTTALNLAASVWGAPGTYVGKWSSTLTYRERTAATLSCLPLMLDDTRQVPPKERETIGQTVYTLADGQGKGRGFVFGAQARAVWCSFTISTGESPLLGTSQDEGARARCLSIEGAPFASRDEAAAVARLTDRHYGHLGARFVDALLTRGRGAITEAWEDRDAAWAGVLAPLGALPGRLAAHIAALDVAATFAHESAGLPHGERASIDEALSVAAGAAVLAAADADKPLTALRAVLTRAAAQQTAFWGRHVLDREGEPRAPSGGWLGQWLPDKSDDLRDRWKHVAIAVTVIRRWLAEDRYDGPGVLAQWAARGWLALPREEARTYDKPVKVDGQSMRCVCILRAASDAAMGDGPRPGGAE